MRREWPWPVLVGLAVLALYTYSLPPSLTLEDSGLFVLAADVVGVAHPPGYPLHTLLSKAFTWLPWGTVAWQVNLLSAVFGALTCSVLWWLARVLTGSRLAAVVAGLGFGASRELWAQSILAEVYSLNTFLFFLLLAVALHHRLLGRPRTVPVLALLVGLGLSHHWPLFLLALAAVALVLWPRRQTLLAATPRALPFLLVGLLPYAWLVLRSHQQPPVSFQGSIDSVGEFLDFVLRRGYAGADASPSAGSTDRLAYAAALGGEIVRQFTVLGLAVVVVGFLASWRRLGRAFAAALLVGFLGATAALLLLLDRDFSFIGAAVFRPYPLISYGFLALWLGAGIAVVRDALARLPHPDWLAGGLGVAVLAACIVSHAPGNVRRDYAWAETHARAVLDLLPPAAVLVVSGDTDTGALGCVHRVLGVRPDVTVVHATGLVFADGPLVQQGTSSERMAALERFLRTTDRTVFTTAPLPFAYGTIDWGPVTQVLPDQPQKRSFHHDPRVLVLCERVEADRVQTDAWTLDHRNQILADCGRHLARVVHFAPGQVAQQAVLQRVQATWAGLLGAIDGLAPYVPSAELLPLLARAEALLDETAAKPARSSLFAIRGFLLQKDEPTAALASFQLAVDTYPHPDNGAVLSLLEVHAARGDSLAFRQLRARIFGAGPVPPTVVSLEQSLGR